MDPDSSAKIVQGIRPFWTLMFHNFVKKWVLGCHIPPQPQSWHLWAKFDISVACPNRPLQYFNTSTVLCTCCWYNRERKCADTFGTVLVSWAGTFSVLKYKYIFQILTYNDRTVTHLHIKWGVALGQIVVGDGTRHLPPSRIHAPVTDPR